MSLKCTLRKVIALSCRSQKDMWKKQMLFKSYGRLGLSVFFWGTLYIIEENVSGIIFQYSLGFYKVSKNVLYDHHFVRKIRLYPHERLSRHLEENWPEHHEMEKKLSSFTVLNLKKEGNKPFP